MLGLTHYDPSGRCYLIESRWGWSRRSAGEALPDDRAREVVRSWARDAPERELRRALDEILGRPPSDHASHSELRSDLVDRVGWDLLVVALPAPSLGPRTGDPEEDEEPPPREEATERHDLCFAFEYPDGSAAAGWSYRFTDLDEQRSDGELPDDGLIRESNVREGVYQVELREVLSVHWLERAVDAGAEVGLVAHVSGFDDGAQALVRIFRQFAERDDQVVDTLDASVAGGKVEHTFRFDYAASERRAAVSGKLRFVAEVSLEDGTVWGKTLEPLAVQLKTLRRVRWTQSVVRPGCDAEIEVRAAGYADGTEVALHLFAADPVAGPRELTVLSASLVGGVARARLLFAPSTSRSDPELEADRLQRAGEYFVRAVIEDDVRREAQSDLVLCDPRPAGARRRERAA